MNRTGFFSIGAALLFSGCAVSICKAPVGEAPLDITKDAEEWAGLWSLHVGGNDAYLNPKEDLTVPVSIEVTDSSNGVLRVHLYFTDVDKERRNLSELPPVYDVYLRRSEDWVFANVEVKDPDKTNSPPDYVWGRVRKDKRVAYLWWANALILGDLQKEGKVPPYVSSEKMAAFNSNHVAQIMSPTNPVPFIWQSPMLFIKQD